MIMRCLPSPGPRSIAARMVRTASGEADATSPRRRGNGRCSARPPPPMAAIVSARSRSRARGRHALRGPTAWREPGALADALGIPASAAAPCAHARSHRTRRRCGFRSPAPGYVTAASIWRGSAAMNSDTRMPASRQPRHHGRERGCAAPATSRPPSVVSSARRSGTRQAACGLVSSAIAGHLVARRHFEIERLQQSPPSGARCRRRGCGGDPRAGAP